MKNSYSQYTAEDLGELGISVTMQQLFDEIKAVNPSPWLLQTLAYNNALPTSTEKARSELLITPVLVELKQRNTEKISIFSGYPFDIDKKRGLKGFCDYLISNKHNAAFVESPVIAIVEVKKDQDLIDASPQCIAEMYAAQLFNQHHQENIPCVYGAVTSGYEWLFLRLEDNQVQIDYSRYFIQNLPELLGAWQTIIDSLCPTPPR
ncbi:MAG: hypothetical protein ACOYMG_02690 [Candidatus Methylumidiphilus sp.]